MKLFELTLPGMVIRFYLMMVVVITAGFTGFWAIALLALPIFLSGMVGMTFIQNNKHISVVSPTAKEVELGAQPALQSQAA